MKADLVRVAYKSMLVLLSMALPVAVVAQSPEGLEVGDVEYFNLTDSPVSGPVEMIVNSNHPVAGQNTFTDVFLVVRNHSNTGTVSVNIDLDLIYADGVEVQPFHLGADRVHILGPNQGVAFFIFFAVPADAPLGTATFRAEARVGRVTGDDDGHRRNDNPMVATDSVRFEVVP